MMLPNAEKAVIAEDKLVHYLLNLGHRKVGGKAKLLLAMGYRAESWQQLEADIRALHLSADFSGSEESDYGTRYDLIAPLTGPSGRAVIFRSVGKSTLARMCRD